MSKDARKLLEEYATDLPPDVSIMPERSEYAPRAFDALRKVLDLHRPVAEDRGDTEPSPPWCVECMSRDGWPCPTVQAITSALAGDPDD